MDLEECNNRQNLHALIIEDRKSDAQLMVHELRRSGYALTWDWVVTEEDYLSKLSSKIDIILADYTLPSFSAPKALEHLKASGLDIPFIVVTGSISEEVAVEIIKQGAADYLIKDRLSRLGQAVRRALEERQLRRAKLHTEEAQSFLAESSAILAASLDYKTTLTKIARLAIPSLCDFSLVDILENDGQVHRVEFAHINSGKEALFSTSIKSYPPDLSWNEHPVSKVLRSGNPCLIEEVRIEEYAKDSKHLNILQALRPTSMISVPMVAHGQILGAITLVYEDHRRIYDLADLTVAKDLAHRAALALYSARLYKESLEAYREAQEANRLKDEFLTTISHELRTPLTSILGWSSLLQSNEVTNEMLKKGLQTIERNAHAQARIVDDLLETSQLITGKLSLNIDKVNLQQLIENVITSLQPASKAKNISIEKELEEDDTSIAGDADRLQQVIWNLLSNAIKFTPRGGKVTLSLKRDDKLAEIMVADTGIGIKKCFLPFVFDRFRQADGTITREFGGLGLGLSIVRYLVEMHGGTVHAESEGEGSGATFIVRLPIKPVEVDQPKREYQPHILVDRDDSLKQSHLFKGLKVVIVEDEMDSRELLRLMLEYCGATVISVESAREALEVIKRVRPDLLISDIGLPKEDGYFLIRKVRSLPFNEGGQVPAIALTAYVRPEDRVAALNAGYHEHVSKPIEMENLISIVNRLTNSN
jgi:signal transduction histidine kinase/DNA-binding response OmpR family regulator